jgi:DNA topoisomerase-2
MGNNNSYDYLLSMPLYNLTKEKIEELKKQEENKQSEYDILDKLEISDIWLSELDKLEKEYDSWINERHKVPTKSTKKASNKRSMKGGSKKASKPKKGSKKSSKKGSKKHYI